MCIKHLNVLFGSFSLITFSFQRFYICLTHTSCCDTAGHKKNIYWNWFIGVMPKTNIKQTVKRNRLHSKTKEYALGNTNERDRKYGKSLESISVWLGYTRHTICKFPLTKYLNLHSKCIHTKVDAMNWECVWTSCACLTHSIHILVVHYTLLQKRLLRSRLFFTSCCSYMCVLCDRNRSAMLNLGITTSDVQLIVSSLFRILRTISIASMQFETLPATAFGYNKENEFFTTKTVFRIYFFYGYRSHTFNK